MNHSLTNSEFQSQQIRAAMTAEEISAEINAISARAQQRMDAGEPILRINESAYRSVGDGFARIEHWMSEEEVQRVYLLKLALPTQAQLCEEARARIAQRIAARRNQAAAIAA